MADQAIVDELTGATVVFYRNRLHKEKALTAKRKGKKTEAKRLPVSHAKMLKESPGFGRLVQLQTSEGFFSVPLQFIEAVQ